MMEGQHPQGFKGEQRVSIMMNRGVPIIMLMTSYSYIGGVSAVTCSVIACTYRGLT